MSGEFKQSIDLPTKMWTLGDKESLKESAVRQMFFLLSTWYYTSVNGGIEFTDEDVEEILEYLKANWHLNAEVLRNKDGL